VSNAEIQDRLAQRVVAEGLSVRALEEIVTVEPEGKRRPARRSAGKLHSPRVAELAGRLSDRFDTRVKVDLGRSKGRITVEFATVEDLERIVELMDPRRPRR
jgi:ParB family chromosome partitioning protein